jgi:ATP-dependent DNA helicase RecQ
MTPRQILTTYWGFSQFRPLQEEIINSVLAGEDTLALLPTGGGKSICFQVPALAQDGICIVISPLISLIKDQVENLQKRGIKALSVTSAQHKSEIDIILDNCIYGKVKFLYISPERIQNELFLERVKKMKINLIAIDEAHCISQWGYDFRPSYLNITKLRELFPKTPLIALTATATKKVVVDIQEKLEFKKGKVFQKSFERKNLSYSLVYEEDKNRKLFEILTKIPASGIVYVRNRKKTQAIAEYLIKHGITADYYHAGLDSRLRALKQENWIQNKTRVIVATNAFGMGIDKPDVRVVVHMDLPDSLEAFFQEAGRAGRDEKKAFAILIYAENDRLELEQNILQGFPNIDEIRKTYQALANYYQIAIGSGENVGFELNLSKICNTYNLDVLSFFNSLKFIEKEGFISTTDAVYSPSRIKFKVNNEDLYKFQIANKTYDNFIKLILRSYYGTFDEFVNISEYDLSQRTGLTTEQITKALSNLETFGIIEYIQKSALPKIFFLKPRIDASKLVISKENYSDRKKTAIEKMEYVIHYATSTHKCRSQILLNYFGETDNYRCGICDICLERNKLNLSNLEFEQVSNQIKIILKKNPLHLSELVNQLNGKSDKSLKVIQWLIDNEKIAYNDDVKLCWKK